MRRSHFAPTGALVELEVGLNVPQETIHRNIATNSRRDLEWLKPEDANEFHAVIVGGGPSVVHHLEELRSRQKLGQYIFACNGAAEWLSRGHGIPVDWLVILDARPENLRFVWHRPARSYLLASQCDPALFDELKGEHVVLFHPAIDRLLDLIPPGREVSAIGTWQSVGLAAAACVATAGFRLLHFYGFDSSDLGASAHAYPQEETEAEAEKIEVKVGDKVYRTSWAMLKQAENFPELAQRLAEQGCAFSIHGGGLLPAVAHQSMMAARDQRQG